ncbi:prepilin-type N-terminal cleavage/methylation domain-containing protein [Profundibacter sp.]
MMRRHHPSPQSGLSLFELLIALALLAFISLALASSFNLGSRLFVKSTEMAALSDELALRSRLRGWLATATPPSLLAGFALKFEGQSDGLTFVTLTPTPFAPDAAGLSVSIKSEDTTLSMTVIAFDDDGAELHRYSGTLANNTTEVRFSYFSATDEIPNWRTEWNETARLPDLVRIEMAEGSQPDWPEFTVKILMSQ